MSQIVVVIDDSERAERIGAALRAAAFDTFVTSSVSTQEFAAAWSKAAALVTDLSPAVLQQLTIDGCPLYPGPIPILFLSSPGHCRLIERGLADRCGRVVPWDGSGERVGPVVAAVAELLARQVLPARQGSARKHSRVDPPAGESLRAAHYRRLLLRREQLVSGLAHDLRTPLTAVQEFADLLEREAGGTLSDRQRHYVEVIQRRCIDAARMLDNLLDALRIQSGRLRLYRRPVLVQQIVAELREGFEAALRHQRIELAMALPDSFPPVFADADLLARVLTNLVNNALKFSPPGATITVAVERATVDLARISVRDEGPGIEPGELRRIFRSYVQGSAMPAGGYGLGLAIVRQLVRYHGGRVSVESKVGRGSTFAFTLPLFVPLAIVRRFLRAAGRRGEAARLSFWGLLLPEPIRFAAAHRLACSFLPAQDLLVPDEPRRAMLLISRGVRPAKRLLERICRELEACACGPVEARRLQRGQIEFWLRAPRELFSRSSSEHPLVDPAGREPSSLTG